MSYDVFDPPEHPEDTEEEIRSLREYLMEMNSSLFSVEELGKLILPYDPQYTQEYKEWLLHGDFRWATFCGKGNIISQAANWGS